MPPPKKRNKLCRALLAAREVHIIRCLKNVLGVPVTKIALATERNKTTMYEALDRKWKAGKRGPKDKLTRADVNLKALAEVVDPSCKSGVWGQAVISAGRHGVMKLKAL